MTIHVWPQNWGWGDASGRGAFRSAVSSAVPYVKEHARRAAAMADGRGKPLVLSEFGLARDMQSHDVRASRPLHRDAFYASMIQAAAEHGVVSHAAPTTSRDELDEPNHVPSQAVACCLCPRAPPHSDCKHPPPTQSHLLIRYRVLPTPALRDTHSPFETSHPRSP